MEEEESKNMVLRDIVFNTEEVLRQASVKDPPGDISLSEIRRIVSNLISPEDKRISDKHSISRDKVEKRVSGILSHLVTKKGYVTKPIEGKPIYRLKVDHPNVQRWIEKKWYEKGITIDGFSYDD